jgi:hypothetical protein
MRVVWAFAADTVARLDNVARADGGSAFLARMTRWMETCARAVTQIVGTRQAVIRTRCAPGFGFALRRAAIAVGGVPVITGFMRLENAVSAG